MAYLKLQQGRAIDVIPNDKINIPSPSAVSAVGVNEASGYVIQDSTKDFIRSVKIGDTVYNTTTSQVSTVSSISDIDTVTVVDDIFNGGDGYKIFSTTDVKTEPCVLYIGRTNQDVENTLTVLTADGDVVTLYNPAEGFVLPIQVRRVFSTGTDNVLNIVALW